MRIKKIVSRNRRDFVAIYKCEHCGHEYEGSGYDDSYYHQEVIPKKECPSCGRTASDTYKAIATKYPEGQTI